MHVICIDEGNIADNEKLKHIQQRHAYNLHANLNAHNLFGIRLPPANLNA